MFVICCERLSTRYISSLWQHTFQLREVQQRHNYTTITVSPKDCLADRDIKLHVSGLTPYQDITISAHLERDDLGFYESYAKYTANYNGIVDLECQAPIDGTYTGVEPMGLFWSLKAPPGSKQHNGRFTIRDVETPVEIILRVFDSHLNESDLRDPGSKLLAETSNVRRYKRPKVRRIPVRWKRVRGTLFVPEGSGPFPALLDLHGLSGGLIEYRAALLASRGFMTLALAYFAYDDLPQILSEIDLSYFEEAQEYLNQRPDSKAGVGIIGSSLGATIATACATYLHGFKSSTSINGQLFPYPTIFRYKQRTWPGIYFNFDRTYRSNGALVIQNAADEYYDVEALGNSLIEITKSDRSFLFILAEDDLALNNEKAVPFMTNLFHGGKGDYRIITYPGAGHLLEPPSTPYAGQIYSRDFKGCFLLGGNPNMHATAESRMWIEIRAFFERTIG